MNCHCDPTCECRIANKYFYSAKVVRVVDGDTIDAMIDVGFDIHHKARIRLLGINTPETRTKDLKEKEAGLAAKAYAHDWLDGLDNIYIQTHKDKSGKFGRILADIYSDENRTACLNSDLIEGGHATAYFGGKR
jgi:micrococcal nuclease